MKYLEMAKNGNKMAISRLISIVENKGQDSKLILQEIFKRDLKAKIIGVTGPPGAGKSTLLDKLVQEYRKRGKKVGVIVIDPSSPFSGGAILGDRIRMNELSSDEGVFIRSMATRGALGGISRSSFVATRVLDYAGFDLVFIETVGVGQSEIDITSVADIVMVIAVPGLGDDIQAIKAGLMEIGDMVVVNKTDIEGADITYTQLQKSFELRGIDMPLMKVSANKNIGISELCESLEQKYNSLILDNTISSRRHNGFKYEIISHLKFEVQNIIEKYIQQNGGIERITEQWRNSGKDPYTLCTDILKKIK
jgi:LAO/AO transport system kinase